MTDNSESLEIIDTVRRKMARAITEHGRSLRAMHEMHMGPFDQALFVDTAIGEIDRLTAERDQAREQLAKLRAACDGTPWLLETARERDGSSWDYPWPEVYADAAAHIRALMAEAERERAQALQPRKTLWERITKRGKGR